MPLLVEARQHARQLAVVYAGAACAHPLILALVAVVAVNFSPTQDVILKFALLYSLFFFVNGTPVALAPTLVLKKQLRFLILAVVTLIVVLQAWETVGADPIGLWLMIAGVPTGAVLLLNTRHLRAIGPIVFAAILLLLYGIGAGVVYATLYVLDAIGPLRFVRADLAQLPILEAAGRYFNEIRQLPIPEMLAAIKAVTREPLSLLQVENPEALTSEVKLHFFSIWLVATSLGVVLSWAFVRWLAWSYQAKRASDKMLTIDVLMAIFTLWLLMIFPFVFGWVAAASVLASFASYKLFARWRLQRHQRSALPFRARTLLFLRVFGYDRRTQQLLEDLEQRWRYLGPIRLIGGTDLAYTTIEPHEFFEFLNGKLSRAFVKGRDELDNRLSESTIVPDPDGLFRIEDFFCHDNTWRMTVSHLARKADAVLMDLRGFTSTNRGCIFEIEQLIASVPLHRIVLLVDGSSDVPFLEQTVKDALRTMPIDSPNAVLGEHRLRIIQAISNHRRTLDTLVGLLCENG